MAWETTIFPGQGSGLGFSLSGGPSALTPRTGLRGAGGLISSVSLRWARNLMVFPGQGLGLGFSLSGGPLALVPEDGR